MKRRLERKFKVKSKRIQNSFKYAFSGFATSFKEERNMRFHILAIIIVAICGIYFNISRFEWIICTILFALVVSAELINTAIENVADMISQEKNPKIKVIKDVSAAAVLVNAIASIIVGLIIFLPKFQNLIL